jgi:hypothetical protein
VSSGSSSRTREKPRYPREIVQAEAAKGCGTDEKPGWEAERLLEKYTTRKSRGKVFIFIFSPRSFVFFVSSF